MLFVNYFLSGFRHFASQHMHEIHQWSNDPPLIKIGGGGFNAFSQTSFLSSYNSNQVLESKEKPKKQKLKKKVNFCSSNYINYCDTNAFFLTPLKKKNIRKQNKIDFKSICKVL